jgi:hypothetical protein
MQDCHCEIWVLVFEEIYLFQNLSMSDQGDLLTEIHRKSAKKFICLFILFQDLGVFKMSLDLVE